MATPPIESSKYLMRRAAQDMTLSIIDTDLTRVYFYAAPPPPKKKPTSCACS